MYGDGLQQREWLHVHDHAAGIIAAARRAEAGSVVHLGGGEPIPNRVVLAMWRDALGADTPEPWLVEAADRPGHDRAYRLHDAASRQRLGWAPQLDLPEGLAATAGWWRTEAATFWADR